MSIIWLSICAIIAGCDSASIAQPDGPAIRHLLNQSSSTLKQQQPTDTAPANGINVRLKKTADRRHLFVLTGLRSVSVDLQSERLTNHDQLQAMFSVRPAEAEAADGPAMLGDYRVIGQAVEFRPRYPLLPGTVYRAIVRWTSDSTAITDSQPEYIQNFHIPDRPAQPTARIAAVYPSRSVLPENLLKFYIHFSLPMSVGQAYEHIELWTTDGQRIEDPFLELNQELWNRDRTRFTLLFDPGRIKRGLTPREEVGPALIEGTKYRLLVDRDWRDALDRPLQSSYEKLFEARAPDDQPIDPKRWQMIFPLEGSSTALRIEFGESLDHALLQHSIALYYSDGIEVAGTQQISHAETVWTWQPTEPWRAGDYRIVIDTRLEDVAGNRVGRPFEVDVFQQVESEPPADEVELRFSIPHAAE